MLSSSEITDMRQVAQGVLSETAQLSRSTDTPDGMGGTTRAWLVVASLPCRIALPTGGTPGISQLGQVLADKIGNRPIYVVTLEYGADVRDGDRLTISGRTYEVLKGQISGSWEIARRAMVVEL